MTRKSNWLSGWIGDLQGRARRCVHAALAQPHANLATFQPEFARTLGCEMSDGEFRDVCAEALAWVIVVSTNPPNNGLDAAWKRASVYSPFLVELLSVIRSECGSGLAGEMNWPAEADPTLDSLLFYEQYLAARDPHSRMERGVFYTPRVVARHIVERIDTVLRDRFELPDGLAATATWSDMRRRWATVQFPQDTSGDECFVRILDPAAGTGVFLIEVVDRIHRTMRDKWRKQGLGEEQIVDRWNAYVPLHLLPRIVAVELMPTPSVISQIAVAQKLAETGYDFNAARQLQFSIADTLLEPDCAASLPLFRKLRVPEPPQAAFTIVLGNPPFRGVSSNPANWIRKLLRGIGPNDRPVANYYEVDGKPLGERKLWLQDDYVKFMRYAQWQIERTGVGVLGFVTNHGYLDNATFRGMRHALLGTFQGIEVFDLHGNRKKNKAAPDGGIDEGMFEIEQGVAIGIFSRTVTNEVARVTHREIWGSREAKAQAIAEEDRVPKARIVPQPPHYLFVPTEKRNHPEYEAGFALNDVMPVNSTAVVTARDSFVVGLDAARLADRMRTFCDSSVSDAEIRSRFFTSSRSTKYPPGDTRGWRLADARQRMMQEADWTSFLRPCLYRPFDRQVIFWADWMIDWPRQDVMRHMLARPNIALVARRQMPPTGPCNYFWITDTIAIDGLIRSDNRGSESVFPLWLAADTAATEENLSPGLVAAIASRLGLSWDASGESTSDNVFGPIDVLHYIYALFNSPTYRLRYSERLRRDFPRVMVPTCIAVWAAFCEIGKRLAELHLMEPGIAEESSNEPQKSVSLRAGYPKFAAGQIWLAPEGPVVPASERVWNYHVGTHQVCRKWLRDRKAYDASTLQRYQQIVALIAETLEMSDRLDATVADEGGWEAVFSFRSVKSL
ncbi:MAG TPA: type ISP restriction/modification enzyme [Pirellulaceae bacterium]|nr:type ISP restriction/modification enzyme [Pirellulaceae bacterium]